MIDLPQTAAALRSVDKELGCGCYSVPRSTGGTRTEQREREKKKNEIVIELEPARVNGGDP